MFVRLCVLILALSTVFACTEQAPSVVAPRTPAPPSAEGEPTPDAVRPRPDRSDLTRIPKGPVPLARKIVSLRRRLRADVDLWTAEGADPRSKPGRLVALESITLQRSLRLLAGNDSLARRVFARLPAAHRRIVARHVEIGARLRALVQPLRRPIRLETTKPLPPNELLRLFRTAARRHDLDWRILAAINFVETRFGRIVGASSAGALGPMQFLPATWQQYGRGGDIRDPHDAIPAAARLLQSAGAASDLRGALLAYNNSDSYADAVLDYAREMRADLRNYYVYWCWEVFVVTTTGDLQLTGPGARRAARRTP